MISSMVRASWGSGLRGQKKKRKKQPACVEDHWREGEWTLIQIFDRADRFALRDVARRQNHAEADRER